MNKKLLNQTICFFIAILTIFLNIANFSATEITDYETYEDITSVIPKSAVEYAESRLTALSLTVKNNSDDFGIEIENVYKLELGTPYVIYSATNNGLQDSIYYFPVIQNDVIIMVLSVIDDNGEYTAGLEKGIAGELNEINYQEDDSYIFYSDEENVYAESESVLEVIESTDTLDIKKTKTQEKNLNEFENLSYEEKIDQITDTYAQEDTINQNVNVSGNSIPKIGANGFTSKIGGIVRLNTSGCTVSQGNYGLCWAASVATTIRYLNYSKYSSLTAKQVADKMGIGYDDGGSVNDIKNALKKYGQTYLTSSAQLSFGKVQTNILAQYPIIMVCYNSGKTVGHAVTCVGYTTYGGIKQVTFWNSGNNNVTTVEYKTGGTKFSYAGYNFIWSSSVHQS